MQDLRAKKAAKTRGEAAKSGFRASQTAKAPGGPPCAVTPHRGTWPHGLAILVLRLALETEADNPRKAVTCRTLSDLSDIAVPVIAWRYRPARRDPPACRLRVLDALRAALRRPARPLVRTAAFAARRRSAPPLCRALLLACLEIAERDALRVDSRRKAPDTARERLADGRRRPPRRAL